MSDIKLFRLDSSGATEVLASQVALEKHLQALIEQNLENLLSVRFLASEHSTGPVHGGRIDSLGLDENNTPVIIEYKRHKSENVINQGLYYLDWLMDHKAEFQLLVQNTLGSEPARAIDWSGPRLVCIAEDFTRYDEHAVKQMNRNIELIRYRKYEDEMLLLELVNAATAPAPLKASPSSKSNDKTVDRVIVENEGTPIGDLWDEVRDRILSLGDDIQEVVLKYYVAFKRLRNFASVEVQKKQLHIYVKVPPGTVTLEEGFTRDVSNIGHFGTGSLEITVQDSTDLDRAWPLIEQSYEIA